MSTYLVTVTPTIMDGQVVRWYPSEAALENHSEAISASRNAVMACDGHPITPELFDAAWTAHLALKNKGDLSHLATHRQRGFLGSYEPVEQAAP